MGSVPIHVQLLSPCGRGWPANTLLANRSDPLLEPRSPIASEIIQRLKGFHDEAHRFGALHDSPFGHASSTRVHTRCDVHLVACESHLSASYMA